MKPYTAENNSGRSKAGNEIHHKTSDGGEANRAATAKAQRKAARQEGKRNAELEAMSQSGDTKEHD